MSIFSGIKKDFGNWKPTRRFFKKLVLAAFLAWYALHPGYVSFSGLFPSYVRVHFMRGRPDNTIQVLDAKTKQPISGAYVNVTWINEKTAFVDSVTEALLTRELVTDAQGRFQKYRRVERGDGVIIDVWKPGYKLRKFVIAEDVFDTARIPSPLALEPWTSVEDALQDRGVSGGTYSKMEQVQRSYERELQKMKERGIEDISQLTVPGARR